MKVRNLTNQKFGKLTVIERKGSDKHNKAIWKCLCECGKITYPIGNNLLKGTTTSCGCFHKSQISKLMQGKLVGNKFSKLKVIKKHCVKSGQVWWDCLCDCGQSSYVTTNNLNSGAIKSCGHCQLKRNGVTTSSPALKIHQIISRGLHNYKTKLGLTVDIALVLNGNKIAIEYDEWYWHGRKQNIDLVRINTLMQNGWKVLHIKANKNIPSEDEIIKCINLLNQYDKVSLVLPNWGKGDYR